jgi:hypothetical protein
VGLAVELHRLADHVGSTRQGAPVEGRADEGDVRSSGFVFAGREVAADGGGGPQNSEKIGCHPSSRNANRLPPTGQVDAAGGIAGHLGKGAILVANIEILVR